MTKSKSKKQDDETKQTDESNNTSSSTTRKKTRKRKPKVDEQSQQLQKQPIQIVSGEFPDKLTSSVFSFIFSSFPHFASRV